MTEPAPEDDGPSYVEEPVPTAETVYLPGDNPDLCEVCTHPKASHTDVRCTVLVGAAEDPSGCPCPLTSASWAGPEEPAPPTLEEMLSTGASYRQLDYWCRRGWLHPTRDRESPRGDPGSGYARVWRHEDLAIAGLMVRLLEAGIETRAAARYATDAVEQRVGSITTASGVTISWRGSPR